MRGRYKDAKGRRMEMHGTEEPGEAAKKEEARGKMRWRKDRESRNPHARKNAFTLPPTAQRRLNRQAIFPSLLLSSSQLFFCRFFLFIVETADGNHDARMTGAPRTGLMLSMC